jgi:hypothetical protein
MDLLYGSIGREVKHNPQCCHGWYKMKNIMLNCEMVYLWKIFKVCVIVLKELSRIICVPVIISVRFICLEVWFYLPFYGFKTYCELYFGDSCFIGCHLRSKCACRVKQKTMLAQTKHITLYCNVSYFSVWLEDCLNYYVCVFLYGVLEHVLI